MLASGLPEQVDDDEDLTRFLTSSSQFNARMVKPAAFLPSMRDRETSVFRHGADPEAALWKLGEQMVGIRTLHGAAVVKTADVRAALLDVVASEPPLRHAAIRGWPWLQHDPELQKAQQKERAVLVASKAIMRGGRRGNPMRLLNAYRESGQARTESLCRSKAVVFTAFCSCAVNRERLSVKVSAMRNSMLYACQAYTPGGSELVMKSM